MTKSPALTDLQLDLMRVLWTRGEATVAEVHRELSRSSNLAQATVATLLTRLEKKGVVEHRVVGRQYVFSPVLAESEVRRAALGRVADRVFTGDVASLVAQLLAERRVTREELEEVKALIEAKEREMDEAGGA